MIPWIAETPVWLLDLQWGLFYVFGPIATYFLACIIGGSILAAGISFVLDIAADLEKS